MAKIEYQHIMKHIRTLRDLGVEVLVDQDRLDSLNWTQVNVKQRHADKAVVVIDGEAPEDNPCSSE